MAPRTAIEILLELLGAQRREARNRTSLRRETDEWLASTRRLKKLNSDIMHAGATGNLHRHDRLEPPQRTD